MERLSLEKIAKGDITEQAKLLFTIAPSKFQKMASIQGVEVETLGDAMALAELIEEKDIDFNWGKFVRALPITQREIKRARQNGLRVD